MANKPRSKTSFQSLESKNNDDVYRDPIYGIPHFHDPAIARIHWKHDPSYQVSQAMKTIYIKSSQRLRSVSSNPPKFIHSRFNIETLQKSPLICFPHFQDMTNFLANWFSTRDAKRKEAVNSSLRATYEAQNKFCDALFLLLQETSRASPISPKPLKGIYNWYLQRDSVISQTRTVEQKAGDDRFIVLELTDGRKIQVPRRYFDINQVFDRSMFDQESISKKMEEIPLETEPEVNVKTVKSRPHKVKLITSPKIPPKKKHQQTTPNSFYEAPFDYEAFHARMEEQRKSEREVDLMAKTLLYKHKHNLFILPPENPND